MMLESSLNRAPEGRLLRKAVGDALGETTTADLGGTASTMDMARAVTKALDKAFTTQ